MSTCPFQRARSPEQKAQRRAQILEAAAGLIRGERFEAISLAAVARRAGVTKAALYRYFPSKEAVFLALYLRELDQVVEAELPPQRPMAEALGELLAGQPLFCRLTAILHTVLEQNLSLEQARQFKQDLLERFAALGQRLQAQYGLSVDQARHYLLQVQQALVGCWAVSHPSPVVDQVLESGPLSVFRVDFARALTDQLRALEGAL